MDTTTIQARMVIGYVLFSTEGNFHGGALYGCRADAEERLAHYLTDKEPGRITYDSVVEMSGAAPSAPPSDLGVKP